MAKAHGQFTALERCSINRIAELAEQGDLALDTCAIGTELSLLQPDQPAILKFFAAAMAQLPLGSVIVHRTGSSENPLRVVDGRMRIAAITRVLRPWAWKDGAGWPVYLMPFDRPTRYRNLTWGVQDDPAALPLGAITRTTHFMTWEANMREHVRDTERANRIVDDAHKAVMLRETPIALYRVEGDYDLGEMDSAANNRWGAEIR